MASIAAIELVEILLEEASVAELGTSTLIDAEVLDAAAEDTAIQMDPMPGFDGPAQLSAGGATPLEDGLARAAWDATGRAGAAAAGIAAAHYSGFATNPNDWPSRTPGHTPDAQRRRYGTLTSSERRRRFGDQIRASLSRGVHNISAFPAMDINATPGNTNMDVDVGIETRPDRKAGRIHRISYKGGKNSGLANDIYRNRPVFGDNLVQQQQNRCTALTMKIGKHEKGKVGDSIETMLHNMSGSASVTSQWAGIVTATIGQRTSFMTVVRHNLSYDENNAISWNATGSDGWPADNILMPNATDIDIGGSTNLKSAFHVHTDHSVWWTPYNRPDLEDMSWNLNKFKLGATIKNVTAYDGPALTGGISGRLKQDTDLTMVDATAQYIDWTSTGLGTGAGQLADFMANIPPSLLTNVAPNRPSYHRRQSEIRLNNQRGPGNWTWVSGFPILPIPAPPTSPVYQSFDYMRGDTYKYNMVIKSGSLLYNFMNKDPNACEVTAVVLKVKKTAMMSGVDSKINGGQLFNRLTVPIGEGYIASIMDKMGTEDLGGRAPDIDDITKLPNFPFLPSLKKTKQQNLPFTEVMRNTFVMPSGSRRKLKIDLPGQVYDPNNIPLCNPDSDGFGDVYPDYPASGGAAAQGTPNISPYYSDKFEFTPDSKYVSICDEYTYAVVFAVNGVQSSRLYYDPITASNSVDKEFLLGDTYAACNLQYNCEYTENIQACEYKKKGRSRLWNNALAVFPKTGGGTMVETTTCILPVGQAVRNPASVVTNIIGATSAGYLGPLTSASVTNTGAGVNDRK